MRRNFGGSRDERSAVATDTEGKSVRARWFGQSSFATHSLVADRNITKVDKDLPLELLGPLGCGIQTGAGAVLISLGVRAGASIAVLGAGAVGLSAVMAARLCGAAVIVAVDLHPGRLALARELGATHTFIGSGALQAQLREATSGGAQFVLDTTGSPELIAIGMNSMTTTGTCGLAGIQRGDLVLGPSALAMGRSVRGIVEGDAVPQTFIPKLVELWRQGRFPFDKLITTYPLHKINEAEKASISGDVVKAVLLPQA